jgi:MoxR-like ATPase
MKKQSKKFARPLLWGVSGVGKSFVVKKVAKQQGIKVRETKVRNKTNVEPVDLTGFALAGD